MKLYFNIGFNFQSAIYMLERNGNTPMWVFDEVQTFNKPFRRKANYPSRGEAANLEFFRKIKKL